LKIITANGELKVTNRPMSEGNIFYDFTNGVFRKLEPTTVDGEVTDKWVVTTPPQRFLNPVDKLWYVNVPVVVDGEWSDKWILA